jgi:twinkle protein
VTLTAGTGIGKSSICRELAYYLVMQGHRVGYIALEESIRKTAESLLAIHMNVPATHLHEVSEEDKRRAFDEIIKPGNLVLYDHWGSQDPTRLLGQVKYMCRAMDCRFIFIDHLSILVSAFDEGDERRLIDSTMTKLRSLVEETGVHCVLVSHLRRPDGRGHEEGAATSLSQLRGSHAIAQLSDAVLGCERDQQDAEEKNETRVRVLKNRYAGITGVCASLQYNTSTGRLGEYMEPVL